MKYTVKYSVFAQEDFLLIKKYIAQFYPTATQKFIAEFKKHIEMIKLRPEMFEKHGENPVYRKMIVLEYVVYYKVEKEKKNLLIYRILHGAQDRATHIEDN